MDGLVHISPHCAMVTSRFGTSLPRYPVLVISIFLTTSMPSTTCPKTTCLPSRNAVGTVVMKNCEPLVLGPPFWRRPRASACTLDPRPDSHGRLCGWGKKKRGKRGWKGTKLNAWADKTTSKKDRSTHRHGEKAGSVMLQIEVLVREGLGAVYAGGPGSIAVEEVATLAHELGDLGEVCMFSKSSFELESYVCSRNVEGGKEIEARLTMR